MSQRQYAYEKIRDGITYGQLRPGERLIEKRLCEQFVVGRTPLREALSQLQIEGYLDFEPNKGVTITRIAPPELRNIYGVLAVLEGYATELATANLNSDDERQLEHFQNEMREASHEKDFKRWMDQNALFHDYLSRASGNSHLHKLIQDQRRRTYRHRLISTAIPDSIPAYFRSHEMILEAMFKGEGKTAGKLMQEHVLTVSDVMFDFMSKIQGL